jgi:hypothetical protein
MSRIIHDNFESERQNLEVDYAGLTKIELANIKGRFRVYHFGSKNVTEYYQLLEAIEQCERVAKKFHKEVWVFEVIRGKDLPIWEVDERIGL